jgi:hypothetical protein
MKTDVCFCACVEHNSDFYYMCIEMNYFELSCREMKHILFWIQLACKL